MDDKNIDLAIKNAEREAKRRLEGFINEEQLGYIGYLRDEMKKILKEQGIEWKPDERTECVN